MNKKSIILILIVIIICTIMFFLIKYNNTDTKVNTVKDKNQPNINQIHLSIVSVSGNSIVAEDDESIIYELDKEKINEQVGTKIILRYTGSMKESYDIVNYEVTDEVFLEDGIPESWQDEGIFSDYYNLAYNKLKTLSLDEKIGQILLVRYPESSGKEELQKYKFGGYVFFEKDFKNKTENQVKDMINTLQNSSNVPILTAVDEEGGKVVRISSNPNLVSEKFKSPKELYDSGGLNLISEDTKEKSNILHNLGINVNLAPVVDVSTDPNDYMYERTIGKDATITSQYAKAVIEASKNTGVSYVLKHFPGYGNNKDTHTGTSVDTRTYESILANDIKPFEAGIKAGAEAVLVSHNIVNNIDKDNPASLSPKIHNLLRDDLDFTGIIITDDLAMSAVSSIDDATVKAIIAGNDLIITTDYKGSISAIKTAISEGIISEDKIDKLVFRVLAWKYYKGLMIENLK